MYWFLEYHNLLNPLQMAKVRETLCLVLSHKVLVILMINAMYLYQRQFYRMIHNLKCLTEINKNQNFRKIQRLSVSENSCSGGN